MARTAIAINGEYKQRYSIYVTPTEYAELSKTLSVLRNTESKDDSDTNNVLRNKESVKVFKLSKKNHELKQEIEALRKQLEDNSVLRNTELTNDNVLRNKESTKAGPLTITLRDTEEKDTIMDILSILRDPKGAKDFVDYVQSDVFDHARAERLMFGYRSWERQEV